MIIKETILDYASQPITKQVLLSILKNYKRPYDKINELVKSDVLVLLKRGVYITGKVSKADKPSPFLLANHLLGPSYVSLESALSYWGLIPEAVYETTSVTIQKSKIFNTQAGRFSYTNLPLPYYSFGIKKITITNTQVAMLASAEKALCDKIVTTKGLLFRSKMDVSQYLLEDARIDISSLKNLEIKEIEAWIADAPKKESLSWLVKTLKKL
jgi:hypothetical protein